MRKRMMAFLMALLMVVTILPANFTIVEANDTNGANSILMSSLRLEKYSSQQIKQMLE